VEATLDACQSDAQTAAGRRGAADRIEHALLDEGVDARAADTEPASRFNRRTTVIDELV
jgi:hypothetical protein